MMPMQTAARAETPAEWRPGLRIREAVPSPANSKAISQRAAYADVLRHASGYLQAGWRWLERKRTQQLSSRRLRVAETISLGEKRSVSIVQADGVHYLIGCSTASVHLLTVLDSAADVAKPAAVSEVTS